MLDSSLVAFHHMGFFMENAAIGEVTPNTVSSSVRTREYLTGAEIERLMSAARSSSRHGHRDATMILIGYRHGLRASELCDLQWSQVELATGRLHVRRAKNGSPSVHPLQGDEIRALRALAARMRAILARVSVRAWRADDAEGFPRAIRSDRGSCQNAVSNPSAHAATWLRLCAGQCGARHSGAASLSRPQEYPAHGALHRVSAGSVQGLLAIGGILARRAFV
jgi:integrase